MRHCSVGNCGGEEIHEFGAGVAAEQGHEPQHGAEGAAEAANGAGMGRQLERAGAGRVGNEFDAPQFQEIHVIAAGRIREQVGLWYERRKWRIKPTAATTSSATKSRGAATPPPPPIHVRLVVAFCARPANGGGILLPSVRDERLYRGGQLGRCCADADVERGSGAGWGYYTVI